MQIDVFFQKNKKCFTRGEKDEVISEKAEGMEGVQSLFSSFKI
jgi:hypothetical protein